MNLDKSNSYLTRSIEALASSSTFSKLELYKEGKTPFCLVKGKGAYTWDIDDNKYIDYSMGMGCIVLGHNHASVNEAIREQLEKGISFSLTTPLEIEVAEMLINRIPSAEKIRFGKNGSDVTSAAVRISRFFTRKEHILFCGYHGWQDWYISQSLKSGGIPQCVKKLSHPFNYNDIDMLHSLINEYKDNVACIILEPVVGKEEKPSNNFLEKVRELATKHKIVLIFDEIVTGFRFHKFGAQTKFGVIPDLSCFGKAIANGLPLSVLAGKEEIMSNFDQVFYSLTNAGETLSLAAAKAVLKFFDNVDVPEALGKSGKELRQGLITLIEQYELIKRMVVRGSNYRFSVGFIDENNSDYDSTVDLLYWTQLACHHGILSGPGHFVSYAHNESIIKDTLQKYDRIISEMRHRL